MPIKATHQFTSWSFSRYNDWATCAFRAKLKHLDKLKEPEGPALARGSQIHKLAEDYATGRLPKLPVELKLFKEEFTVLRANRKRLLVEQQWALNVKWEPTGWFDRDAWVRIVIDVGSPDAKQTVLDLIDHKTGKIREVSKEQLTLYAIAGFAQMPTLKLLNAKLWYLDAGEEITEQYKPADVPALKKKWEARVKPMLADTKFKPTPNEGCRWCHFRKGNGGPCKY